MRSKPPSLILNVPSANGDWAFFFGGCYLQLGTEGKGRYDVDSHYLSIARSFYRWACMYAKQRLRIIALPR